MAFTYFVDDQGNPIGGDKNADPQQGGTTILNFWRVYIEFEGSDRLRGVIRVEDTDSGTLNIFGLYDTSLSPTVEFFGDGPNNNRVFIQANDELQLRTVREGNSTVDILKRLEFERYPETQTEKNRVENEVSNARFVSDNNRLEFKNEFGLNQEKFLKEIPNYIILHNLVSLPSPDGYQTAVDETPKTPANEQEISNARRVQRVKEWLQF